MSDTTNVLYDTDFEAEKCVGRMILAMEKMPFNLTARQHTQHHIAIKRIIECALIEAFVAGRHVGQIKAEEEAEQHD